MIAQGRVLARDLAVQLAGGRRLAGLAAMSLFPAALVLLLRWLEPAGGPAQADALRWRCFVWIGGASLLLQAVGLWLSLSLAPSIVSEDPLEGGLEYALSRPVPKRKIFLWRWLSCALLCGGLLLAGQAAAAAAAFAGTGILSTEGFGRGFAAIVLAQALAAGLYTALGALLALLTSRPVVYGILYLFFGEMVLASIQDALVARFTLLFHLRSLVAQGLAEVPEILLKEMLFPLTGLARASSAPLACCVLAGATAAAVALAAWQFSVREWRPPQHER